MKARVLALILAILTLISPAGLYAAPVKGAEWSADYRSWSQSDPLWGKTLIGNKTMSSVGCLIVAVAKLMVHAGQQDPAEFNPGIALAQMKERNLFHGTNSMYIGELDDNYFSTYAPELTDVYNSGNLSRPLTEKQAAENFRTFIQNGYYIIVMTNTVRNTTHWMAVDDIVDGHVMVMDNRGVIDLYDSDQYNGVARYLLVKYTGKYTYPASRGNKAPDPTSPQTLDRSEVYSAPDQLRIRSAPSLSSPVIGGLAEGERVRIKEVTYADGYVWGRMDMGGWCAISLCSYISGSLYYVFFDAGDGGNAPDTLANPYGQSVSLPDEIPTWEGHTFLGWASSPDASVPEFAPGEQVDRDADLTLYAVWDADRSESYLAPDLLRIRKEPNLSSDKIQNLEEGSLVTVYETAAADGYTWGRLKDGGWCAISICTYVKGSLNYIFYHKNGGFGGVIYQQNPTDQSVTLSSDAPELEGFTFRGYALTPDGDPVYHPGDQVSVNADLHLYAIFGGECNHEYRDYTVPPTEDAAGYTEHICQLCGSRYQSDYTDSLGLVTQSDGVLHLTLILADGSLSGAEALKVHYGDRECLLDSAKTDVSEDNGLTTVYTEIYGLSTRKGQEMTLNLTIGDRTARVKFTPTADFPGYDTASATSGADCYILTLYTDAKLAEGDTGTALSDSGKEYPYSVDYRHGRKTVLTFEHLDAKARTLTLKGLNLAVLLPDTNPGLELSCPEDRYFTSYYQTRKNEDDPALTDLRFVILGNISKLETVESASVTIRFYSEGAVIRQLNGVLGGEKSNYQLFRVLTAAGDLYLAADGSAMFGQQVIGVPAGAFDRISLQITDQKTGKLLLDSAVNTGV